MSTHRPSQLLFRVLLLQSLLLDGLLGGGGRRQVLRAEAEALQKLKDSVIFFLELCNQVTPFSSFGRKLHGQKKFPVKLTLH